MLRQKGHGTHKDENSVFCHRHCSRFCRPWWCSRRPSRRRTPRSIVQQDSFPFEGARQNTLWRISKSKVARTAPTWDPKNHCSGGVGVHGGPPHHPKPPPPWPWTPAGLWDHSGGGGEVPRPNSGAPWLPLPHRGLANAATYGSWMTGVHGHGGCLAFHWPQGSLGGAGGAWWALVWPQGRPDA